MQQNSNQSDYVLITPAYNEEAYLERTIRSVIAQTHLPEKWVIVSDNSTDRTDDIAISYAEKYRFIDFIRHEDKDREESVLSARKVSAINAGFKRLDGIDYEYFGNLDADISFSPDFYSSLIGKLEKDTNLGLAGSFIYNVHGGKTWGYFTNSHNVGGPIQFFRRQCYEDIGGYHDTAYEDSIAVTMARMKGWEARSFPDIRAYHHKCAGLPGRGLLRAKFHVGKMEHVMGDHFIYEIARCAGDILKKPIAIGSFSRLLGYTWSALKGNSIQAPADVVKYNRNDQLRKLKKILSVNTGMAEVVSTDSFHPISRFFADFSTSGMPTENAW